VKPRAADYIDSELIMNMAIRIPLQLQLWLALGLPCLLGCSFTADLDSDKIESLRCSATQPCPGGAECHPSGFCWATGTSVDTTIIDTEIGGDTNPDLIGSDTTVADANDAADVTDTVEVTDIADSADAADATDVADICAQTVCSGACVDTDVDIANCGACGTSCSSNNGTAHCTAGVCEITCDVGFDDCDADLTNGCEAELNGDTANCSACGAACDATNGTPACITGACSLTCDTGFDDCDGDVTSGCETDTQIDTAHCGACRNPCGGVSDTCCSGGCFAVEDTSETLCGGCTGQRKCCLDHTSCGYQCLNINGNCP